jgi:hypothetical protein
VLLGSLDMPQVLLWAVKDRLRAMWPNSRTAGLHIGPDRSILRNNPKLKERECGCWLLPVTIT